MANTPNRVVIYYSEKLQDAVFEYRHVTIPQSLVALLPKGKRLLSDCEWRAIGVQQSRGWEHYYTFADEPHVLPFRRRLH